MMIHLVDRFESDNNRIYRKIDRFFSRLTWFVQPTSNNASESVDDLKSRIEFLTNQLKDINEKVIELQLAYEYEKARNEKVQGAPDTSILGLYATFE
jgi:chaperonin cofactor prefoldin